MNDRVFDAIARRTARDLDRRTLSYEGRRLALRGPQGSRSRLGDRPRSSL
jgi:hypothetical protein